MNREIENGGSDKEEVQSREKRRRREAKQGRVWTRKTKKHSKLPVMTHKPALHRWWGIESSRMDGKPPSCYT